MVERVIRTLKTRIMKFQTLFGTFRYIDNLQEIVEDYNNTVHSKTKMAPNSITENYEKRLLKTVYNNNNIPLKKSKQRFKLDDYVRISRIKKLFEKGMI